MRVEKPSFEIICPLCGEREAEIDEKLVEQIIYNCYNCYAIFSIWWKLMEGELMQKLPPEPQPLYIEAT